MKKQSWWQLLSIQAGGTLCLPVIMMGQLICQKYGWLAACLCLGIGNLFLLGIGLLLASLSTHRPKSTVEQAASYFGNKGRILFASLMIFSMLGWFGIQLNMMSLSLGHLFEMMGIVLNPLFLNISIGIAMSCVMCFGMKAMKWLSNLTSPLMGLTLLYAIFFSTGTFAPIAPLSISFLGGVSLIIGANIAAVIDLPTFFQYAKSKRDAQICIWLLFGLIVPFIEGVGIFLTVMTQGASILGVLQSGGGMLWNIWVSCFVIFAGWTTNNANLYSAIASSYSLPGKLPSIGRTLALGLLGILFACLNPLGNIEAILNMIGISVGGMGAVMISNFLLEKKYKTPSWISFLSWILGVTLGISSAAFGVFITGVPAFDAFITASVSQIILSFIFGERYIYETNNSQ
ncbi:MAG: hypothetical protein K1000chlam3_01026 [Chlamydiae bacterium]|nr:hypothetical protein [Chlamydiota bacterium]